MTVWNFIHDKHQQNIPVILLYVLSSTGSSPGRKGFKMAVAADHSFAGSIGGGIMEHKFVEMARSILLENTQQQKDTYRQIHSKQPGTDQSGMICSGEQTIFLHQINAYDAEAVRKIIAAENKHTQATLVLTKDGIDLLDEIAQTDFIYEVKEEGFLLKEKLGFKSILHIIGGGHCALALSILMSQMDFYIHVYDDRKDLDTLQKNSYAHEIHLLASYDELPTFIQSGGNVFVVIMTFGYRTDDLALRALLDKQVAYLGVMGSKKKIEQMFQTYRAEGIDEELISRLHAPIGLQIKSETPAEIAVSIAAEIIRVKNAGA